MNKLLLVFALAAIVGVAFANNTPQRRLPREVQGRVTQAITYPCRFDCMQLVTKATGQPLFSTCQNSVVSYSGDYFGQSKTPGFDIDYQCFTPSTYQSYFASRGKLAFLLNICQDNSHRCRRPLNRQFDTSSAQNYAGIPNIATLAVRTTSKYYQWYSQFASLSVVNNVVRCPASYLSSRNNRRSCNCDLVHFPELFSDNNAKMPTATSNGYVNVNNLPTPISPYSSYAQGFLGNYNNINPFPSVVGEVATLLQSARAVSPVVVHPVYLGCIDDDVDITSDCDDGR